MAFSPATKVRVADQSSEYRGRRGVVMEVASDNHLVRLDGNSCSKTVRLRTDQLKQDYTTHVTDYSQC